MRKKMIIQFKPGLNGNVLDWFGVF